MRSVTVVGAGFSGLTLAFELQRLGLQVKVIERQKRPGGLLDTHSTPEGLVETAANALLANREVEELFLELDLPFAERLPARRKRFVYWERPRRWPLGKRATAKLLWTAGRVALGKPDVLPRKGETVHDWAVRTVGEEVEERLLQPGLQGVFAGDTRKLSAVLTLSNMLGARGQPGTMKGSVAPARGMGHLISRLASYLEKHGAELIFDRGFTMPEYLTEPIILCTSAWAAADILKSHDPRLAARLGRCEALPLVSVTAFFPKHARDLQGFGCLFPPSQGFAASGILFNDCIFAERSQKRSETWIFGGSLRPEIVTWSDEEIVRAIARDREKLTGRFEPPEKFEINRWPRAIPHYTVDWEREVAEMKANPPVFLHGNYLGSIGLSRIYSRSRQLAREIKEMYG